MPTATVNRLSESADGRTATVRIDVTSEPPGIRQITILDRTRRRTSGITDSSATIDVNNCPPEWSDTFTVFQEYFPLHVEVVQCDPQQPKQLGRRETFGPFPLPEDNLPTPNCSDPTRALPPSRECIQANTEAQAARNHVASICAMVRALEASLNEYRRRFDSYMIAFAALIAAAAVISVIPGIGVLAFAPIGAALVLFGFAIAMGLRARALNDQLTDARHRLNLAQVRYIILSSRVRMACCPWDITANLDPVDCAYMPAWGGLGVGEIGEPGG